jgi:anti-sigma regulatory factor (Ser/Thr protein kinase)
LTNTERVAPREHVVLFYENDAELRLSAGAYLREGLLAGSVAVVIASASHRALLGQEVAASGLDLGELSSQGSWITLDAAETISRLIIDGRPDPAAFEAVVGELIVGVASQGRQVCAYGEMVDLLWDARQVNAALELEELWNGLGERTPFSLFCSYASSSLSDPAAAHDIELVCSHHSAVVDPDTYHLEVERRPLRHSAHRFSAALESVTHARHFVAETLLAWGFDQIGQEAQLVVSELAGNAVRHARSAFSVVISEADSSLRLAVSDMSHALPTKQRPANSSSSGRGLMLVAALAIEWGVEQSLDGKVVWAELSL